MLCELCKLKFLGTNLTLIGALLPRQREVYFTQALCHSSNLDILLVQIAFYFLEALSFLYYFLFEVFKIRVINRRSLELALLTMLKGLHTGILGSLLASGELIARSRMQH